LHTNEMTMSEVLRDPMIRQMLRADRVPLGRLNAQLARIDFAARSRAIVASADDIVPLRRKTT